MLKTLSYVEYGGMVIVLGYGHNFDSKNIAQSKFLGLRFSP
jgi:hypothetical protein